MRVTHYHARSVYEDGSVHSRDYPFMEGHARAAGTALERDGIGYEVAQRLVEGWNREAARHNPRRYYYTLRVEDQLANLDRKS